MNQPRKYNSIGDYKNYLGTLKFDCIQAYNEVLNNLKICRAMNVFDALQVHNQIKQNKFVDNLLKKLRIAYGLVGENVNYKEDILRKIILIYGFLDYQNILEKMLSEISSIENILLSAFITKDASASENIAKSLVDIYTNNEKLNSYGVGSSGVIESDIAYVFEMGYNSDIDKLYTSLSGTKLTDWKKEVEELKVIIAGDLKQFIQQATVEKEPIQVDKKKCPNLLKKVISELKDCFVDQLAIVSTVLEQNVREYSENPSEELRENISKSLDVLINNLNQQIWLRDIDSGFNYSMNPRFVDPGHLNYRNKLLDYKNQNLKLLYSETQPTLAKRKLDERSTISYVGKLYEFIKKSKHGEVDVEF